MTAADTEALAGVIAKAIKAAMLSHDVEIAALKARIAALESKAAE